MQALAKPLEPKSNLYNYGFGLFNKSLQTPLPLVKLDISVDVYDSTAKVTFSQTYRNNTDALLETEYFFPIPPNARFDTFQAVYENKTIDGVIREKETAQKEYQQHLKNGNTVAYAEILQDAPDVMQINIGNIHPSSDIQITFSYTQKLEIVRSRFYRFVFYAAMTPRYHSSRGRQQQQQKSQALTLSQYPIIEASKEAYAWNIRVNIYCSSPITFLDCQSHKIVSSVDTNPCKRKLSLDSGLDYESVFNRNFDLLFSYETINAPNARLAKNDKGFCAMIDFLPRYDDEPLEDAIKAAKTDQEKSAPIKDINMMTATGEFLFLLDRSGSMSGDRIEMAKEALIFALKSLPPKSYFNVISFGSKFYPLAPQSFANDEKNVSDAISQIKRFSADMGGTEIYSVIEAVLSSPRLKNYPRTLFLLTDGDVTNPDQIIKLVHANNHRARIFALGIGTGCSTYLVNNCAQAGKGKSAFVYDSKDISNNVISLMESALTPLCDDFKLEFSKNQAVAMIVPDPQSVSHILRNEKVNFYVFIDNEAAAQSDKEFIVTLKYYDSAFAGYRESTIKLDLDNYETGLDVFKLAVGEAADVLEKKSLQTSLVDNLDICCAAKEGIDQEIVKMSIEYQVLTRRTAFVCVVRENAKDEVGNLNKEKVLVPQIRTHNANHRYEEGNLDDLSQLFVAPCLKPAEVVLDPAQIRLLEQEIMKAACSLPDDEDDLIAYSDDDDVMYTPKRNDSICFGSFVPVQESKGSHLDSRNQALQSQDFIKYMEEKDKSIKKAMDIFDERPELSVQKKVKGEPQLSDKNLISESTITNISEQYLLEIIQKQKIVGCWDYDLHYLEILGLTQTELLTKVPQEIKNAGGNFEQIAMTLVILVWIEKHFQSKKPAWSLIHKKGVDWLNSLGLNYAELAKEINFV